MKICGLRCALWLTAGLGATSFAFWHLEVASAHQVPQEIQIYKNVRPIMELSPGELVSAFPELKGLAFVDSQGELPSLLEKVGGNVEAFFRYFPNTTSLERARACVEEMFAAQAEFLPGFE